MSLLFPSFSTRSSGGLWSFCGPPSNPSSTLRTRDGEKYVVGSGTGEGGGSQGSFRMPWRGWASDRRNDDVNERPAVLDGCSARGREGERETSFGILPAVKQSSLSCHAMRELKVS